MIYYVKQGRKYIPVGNDYPRNFEGLYYHQFQEHGSRTTSVSYWMGNNPKQPVDVNSLIGTMRLDEELAIYISKLQDENSEEYKQAKEDCGGYVKEPLRTYGFSNQDLAVCILRKIHQLASQQGN